MCTLIPWCFYFCCNWWCNQCISLSFAALRFRPPTLSGAERTHPREPHCSVRRHQCCNWQRGSANLGYTITTTQPAHCCSNPSLSHAHSISPVATELRYICASRAAAQFRPLRPAGVVRLASGHWSAVQFRSFASIQLAFTSGRQERGGGAWRFLQ